MIESERPSVLLVHGYYRQRGGEDAFFENDRRFLDHRGHRVLTYTCHNDAAAGRSGLGLAASALWNQRVYEELRDLVRRERPAIVQVQNILPLISPAAFWAAKRAGAAVVLNAHNYRLLCPNGLFFRQGRVCEDCLGRGLPWPGVIHRCYRGSFAASATVAAMLALHRVARTWQRKIDVLTVPSEFLRQKLVEGGVPRDKIVLRRAYMETDPGIGRGGGGFALFVGRLSEEKGLDVLLDAWRRLESGPRLKIVGDGPLAARVRERAGPNVECLGRLPREAVYRLMRRADLLVLPSICYEAGPTVICEAFAAGLPVVASRHGSMAALVEDERTGVLFEPGASADLAAKVVALWSSPERWPALRRGAREEFERSFHPDAVYRQMLAAFDLALARGGAAGARLV